MAGDLELIQGGTHSLDPVVDGILMDSICQQQGWVRVNGKSGPKPSFTSLMNLSLVNLVVSTSSDTRAAVFY